MTERSYFVSFLSRGVDGTNACGWMDIVRDGPIRNGKDVEHIQDAIKNGLPGCDELTIMSWRLFEEATDGH